ncbi:SDR family oxidoreductase [Legionella worsleiensis]|uniref:Oxidoreductase with NAD(P)-binding Rossmann-fold domain protein n=1 Tax=Legionella worsleiensis TaxID=45076 RepID=A0A0W1AKY9_9GAMM|nr:SDR family oxidoreductase [Legionella worsleiensis]KTD81985.1 oxidoreductase with NAD(P)-binding Rossmann-fold domain protein [Legionella worsleiensis]STY30389.1 oxidoreductase with NAD(P)-binding Rossmann-fold domain [Legionella worsleiensis]
MKTALVTGANKGIGLEFCRQLKARGYYVIGSCRNPSQADKLKQTADEVIKLDVTNDHDISSMVKTLNNRPIDLLINNAGTSGEQGVTVGNVSRENFIHVMNVNCISVMKICDALLPNIQASQHKNILAISSRMGSISDNQQGRSYAYRSSKAALNCAMRSFAIDVASTGVHVMLIHPGWVKTDMGGPNSLIDVQASVSGMLEQVDKKMSTSQAEVLHRFDGGSIAW